MLNQLERNGAEIGYVKTANGLEVDFLARYATGGEELLQVCADVSAEGTRAREVAALEEAAAHYPRAARRLLVLDRDSRAQAAQSAPDAQPAYEWLLAGAQKRPVP